MIASAKKKSSTACNETRERVRLKAERSRRVLSEVKCVSVGEGKKTQMEVEKGESVE